MTNTTTCGKLTSFTVTSEFSRDGWKTVEHATHWRCDEHRGPGEIDDQFDIGWHVVRSDHHSSETGRCDHPGHS